MNIDSLGPETVDDYFERGLIKDAAELYQLQVSQLCGADRSREKSARKVIDGIAKSKEVPFDRVLYALGIRFVGKVVAKLLARHFKSIDNLQAATLDELLQVEGVGTVIAQSVKTYLTNEANQDLIQRLKVAGVQMEMPEQEQLSESLAGKSIVISGTCTHHSREEYKTLIDSHGGKNVSSISKKTSFILAGENMGPSKLEKAQKLGVALMNEEDFLQLIGEKSTTASVQGALF